MTAAVLLSAALFLALAALLPALAMAVMMRAAQSAHGGRSIGAGAYQPVPVAVSRLPQAA